MDNLKNEFNFSDHDFDFIAKLVNDKTGIVMSKAKKSMLYSRLSKRIRILKLKDFSDYCNILRSDKGDSEIENFINSVTTNLTNFFREPYHFAHLKTILPEIIEANAKTKRFRLWSAGCSTGQEPYSIKMVLNEAFLGKTGWDMKLLATDIDTEVVNKAQKGEYNIKEIENIDLRYRTKYCKVISEEKFVMSPELKKNIHFKKLNLLEGWPMKNLFQIIFCRNVVIYFDKETQRELFDRYADQLCMGGYLYIGHSEDISNISDRFKLVGKTVYRRIK